MLNQTNHDAAVLAAAFGFAASIPVSTAHAADAVNPDEVRVILAETLADAEGRTSLLAGTSGASRSGLSLQGDGYELNVSGQIQFQYIINSRSDDDADDFDSGFRLRRTRLVFAGTVEDDWSFKVQSTFRRSGGSLILDDAKIGRKLGNGWRIDFGQFRLASLHEELVSSRRQQAVERSFVTRAFSLDRSQQIQLRYSDDTTDARFAFFDGRRTPNADFNSSSEAEYGVIGRVDVALEGDRGRFKDFTSKPGESFAARVGAAAAFTEMTVGSGSQTGDPMDIDRRQLFYTADASLEGDGWNAFAAFVGRYTSDRAGGDSDEFNDFGVVAQGGVYVGETTEIFGRWDSVFYDDDRDLDGPNTVSFVTFGVQEYIAGHTVKLTADTVIALNETTAAVEFSDLSDTSSGLLGSMDEGEVVIRLQLQLLF